MIENPYSGIFYEGSYSRVSVTDCLSIVHINFALLVSWCDPIVSKKRVVFTDFFKHLWWSFMAKIVNGFSP